jgi:beta-N-acetylhexosaminidase
VRIRVLAVMVIGSAVVAVAPQPGAVAMWRPEPAPDNDATVSAAHSVRAAQVSCASQTLAGMSLPQQVGQLLVTGVDSTSPTQAQLDTVGRRHVGGVILTGHNANGVTATRRVTHRIRAAATSGAVDGVKPWISVDQEGGFVQTLNGPGFSSIPTALTQGSWTRSTLLSRAQRWGRQLRAAGVNLDLAPVADTVPTRVGTANAPIGFYRREYGHHPKAVARHVTAVVDGLEAARVQATAKHFPGLGRVRRNTDVSVDVTDHITTRDDPYLLPFKRAVNDGVPVVMVSLALYTRIDPAHLAVFSPTVMGRMLRHDLGFTGVIMSDSMTAVAVEDVPAGARAVRFLRAGGTVALSVDSSLAATMAAAVLRHARSNTHFRATVRQDALTVLRAKHRNGLLTCT